MSNSFESVIRAVLDFYRNSPNAMDSIARAYKKNPKKYADIVKEESQLFEALKAEYPDVVRALRERGVEI